MKIFAKLFRKDKEKPIETLVDLTFNNMNGKQIEDLCKDIDETINRKKLSKAQVEMLYIVKNMARREIDKRWDIMAEEHNAEQFIENRNEEQ